MKTILNLSKSVILVFSLALISCDKEDCLPTSICEVQNPIEELAWLKDAIDEVRNDEYSYYSTALYQGERIFFYGNCNPTANYASFVQNCSGENLGNTSELYDRLSQIKVIWKPENSTCNL